MTQEARNKNLRLDGFLLISWRCNKTIYVIDLKKKDAGIVTHLKSPSEDDGDSGL